MREREEGGRERGRQESESLRAMLGGEGRYWFTIILPVLEEVLS